MAKKTKHRYDHDIPLPPPVLTTEEVQAIQARAIANNNTHTMALCEVALDESAPHAMRVCRQSLKRLYEVG